jgi:hypothetical protein
MLADNNLAVTQSHRTGENGLEVKTRLWHSSGEWIESDWMTMPVDARHAQAVGSASTYGRRYSISALLGLVTDEDDGGNLAAQNARNNSANTRPTPPNPDGENGEPKTTKQHVVESIQEWSGVDGEDLKQAIRQCCEKAGVPVKEGTPLKDAQWYTVWTWIQAQKQANVDFVDAVKNDPQQEPQEASE